MIQPFFSLAVVTYNSEATVGETLDSIGKLDGLGDVELIVADDGSRDGTRDIVERWLSVHTPRFCSVRKVFLETNSGISTAHTSAFAQARGIWGLYLGGDDLIVREDIFPQLRSLLEKTRGSFFRIRVKEYYPETGEIADFSSSYSFMRNLSAERQFRALVAVGNPFRSGPGSVFRIGTLHALDGFGSYNPAFEDWQLFLKFTRSGYRIGILDLDGILWRRHRRQFSATSYEKMLQANRVVRRLEITPYLERLSLFERWKYRYSGRLGRRIGELYRSYLETWGKLFHE
ncbi:MAG TPA: glycosyltransferase family 2 protein [Rectinemataceae bacterium]|nr:glycosyltransferase family 2 protein [Rectinemataceae bacterium]